MKESKQMRHFTAIADLNVAQKQNLVWWPSFSSYCIPVYVTFIIVKNCGFVMGFVILAIHFQLKSTIFNVKS